MDDKRQDEAGQKQQADVAPAVNATDFLQEDVEKEQADAGFQFGVSKQLALGFSIVVLLTIVLAVVAIRGHLYAERTIDDIVEGYGSTASLALQARNEFLLARNAEKEYLLYYRDSNMALSRTNHAEHVREHLNNMQAYLNSAETLFEDTVLTGKSRELLLLVQKERVDYEETFFEMVKLFEQRGNYFHGLESKFRRNLDAMDELLTPKSGSRSSIQEHLAVDLLKIRKHEQYYLLNKEQAMLAEMQEELGHFSAYMGNYPADVLRSQMKKYLSAYQANFKQWVEVDKQAEQSMDRFAVSAGVLEKSLMDWYALTSKHVKNVELALESDLKSDRSLLIGVAVLAVLMGMMVAMVLSRRIGGAVRTISRAAQLLKDGDSNSRVVVHEGDEFGELAKVFNEMAEGVVSKNYAENIFRSLSDSLIVLDGKARIVEVNRATLELLGYSEEELRGQTIDMILRGHSKGSLLDSRSEFLAGKSAGGLMNIERIYFSKDGRKLPMFFSASELLDEQQNLIGTVCVAQDLTAYKSMEAELQEKQTQLIHAGRLTALGEMGAGIAHEINQPLNAISLAAQWLEGELKKNENKSMELDTVRDILAQIDRVSKIIKNMRSFARRGNEGVEQVSPVQLAPCVDVAFSFFREQFRKQNIHLSLQVGENLPMVRVDPQKFEQVLVNFSSNARYAVEEQAKLAEDGYQKHIQVRLLYEDARNAVVLEVEDNGNGMVAEQRERCLEPFYTTKPVGEGTGLGLSIVHSIVKEFNMGFDVVSGIGIGTTVRIEMEVNHD